MIIANRGTLAYTPASHPVIVWFAENYRPFSKTKDFLLLARVEAAGWSKGCDVQFSKVVLRTS